MIIKNIGANKMKIDTDKSGDYFVTVGVQYSPAGYPLNIITADEVYKCAHDCNEEEALEYANAVAHKFKGQLVKLVNGRVCI